MHGIPSIIPEQGGPTQEAEAVARVYRHPQLAAALGMNE